MNPFETDYLQKTKELAKEAFKLKKYKVKNKFVAILIAILFTPFISYSLSLLVALAIGCFFFKIIKSPIEYLHSLVKKEGSEVQHATQAVIYLVSWPLVIFLYALNALLLVILNAGYAMLSIFAFIATLGGFKYHVFISDADDISIEVPERKPKEKAKKNNGAEALPTPEAMPADASAPAAYEANQAPYANAYQQPYQPNQAYQAPEGYQPMPYAADPQQPQAPYAGGEAQPQQIPPQQPTYYNQQQQ